MVKLPDTVQRGIEWLLVLGLLGGMLPAISGTPSGPQASGDELGYLPGQLIVKFTEAAVATLGREDKAGLDGSGWPSLSQLHRRYQVEGIQRLFPDVANAVLDKRYGLSRIYRLRVPLHTDIWAMARDYAALAGIVYAEPNRLVRLTQDARPAVTIPNDPRFGQQWNLHNTGQTRGTVDADVDAPEAWEITTGNSGVLIAVLDTGVDYNHPDLAAKVRRDIDWDFADEDDDALDPGGGLTPGHGTGVASVAAAVADDGHGMAGMCWGCQLLPVRVGSFVVHIGSESVARGIVYAADQGARVVNMSLGGQCSELWADAVNYAYDQGTVLVAATGNHYWYQPVASVAYPAKFGRVIAVAGTDHNDRQAGFSNHGPEVDVAAPAANVLHAQLGGGWGLGRGTSYAAPHVAGLVGLLLSLRPELTPEQVRHILRSSADDLGPPGPDESYGYGRINAVRALNAVIPEAPPVPADTCGCVLEEALASPPWSGPGEKPLGLDLLYRLRDQVLTTSPLGQRYTGLYYRYSPELSALLLLDGQLRAQSIAFLRAAQPALEAVIIGDSATVLTRQLIQEAEALVQAVARRASPDLRRTVLAEWQALDLWKYAGQPVKAVWGKVREMPAGN